jgi:1,4-alpha-glucan branching enzyme
VRARHPRIVVPTSATANPDDHGLALVTFRLPAATGADRACVVGEFNDWSQTATPMAVTADGFEATIELPYGRQYRFRYLIDGHRWENDWAADAYVPNEYGGDDSVLDLTTAPPASPPGPDSPGTAGLRRHGDPPGGRPRPVRTWQ